MYFPEYILWTIFIKNTRECVCVWYLIRFTLKPSTLKFPYSIFNYFDVLSTFLLYYEYINYCERYILNILGIVYLHPSLITALFKQTTNNKKFWRKWCHSVAMQPTREPTSRTLQQITIHYIRLLWNRYHIADNWFCSEMRSRKNRSHNLRTQSQWKAECELQMLIMIYAVHNDKFVTVNKQTEFYYRAFSAACRFCGYLFPSKLSNARHIK